MKKLLITTSFFLIGFMQSQNAHSEETEQYRLCEKFAQCNVCYGYCINQQQQLPPLKGGSSWTSCQTNEQTKEICQTLGCPLEKNSGYCTCTCRKPS